MGFVSEELNETEKQLIKGGKASNMAVVYGKEASIWKVSGAHPPLSSHAHNSIGDTLQARLCLLICRHTYVSKAMPTNMRAAHCHIGCA